MYLAIYLNYGKRFHEETYSANFSEETINKLDELNLMNYHMDESQLEEILYLSHYGNQGEIFGRLLAVVPEHDKERILDIKKKLKSAAIEQIAKRMNLDKHAINELNILS